MKQGKEQKRENNRLSTREDEMFLWKISLIMDFMKKGQKTKQQTLKKKSDSTVFILTNS